VSLRTFPVVLAAQSAQRCYPIYSGPGLLSRSDLIADQLRAPRVMVVSNKIVAPLYLERLAAPLRCAGVAVDALILPDGEQHKNWASMNRIFDTLLKHRCDRHTTLIALGGGVIGDLVGFAAASYQRGMPFIQVPTTLLAQVDSSVGGKTGINHRRGKNMIGAFWQPQMVLADTDTLGTLPERELSSGLAEVIKYGLIRDPAFLTWLEHNMSALRARDPHRLADAIEQSCRHKAAVVGDDERETAKNNGRALLNLGHTFAHAIEAGMGYGRWLHGEAVGAGLVMAAECSRRCGWLSDADVMRVRALCQRAGLPIQGPALADLPAPRYLEYMRRDKKNTGGALRLVLLRALGEAFTVTGIDEDQICAAIAACCPAQAA
jgi:3-dehydroquinate synthase